MMGDNSVVTIRRPGPYNPATKVTPGYADKYVGVSCFIEDVGRAMAAKGFAVEWELEMSCDVTTDIQPDDQITGYNPLGLTKAPIYVVGRVSVDTGGLGQQKRALLKAFRPG